MCRYSAIACKLHIEKSAKERSPEPSAPVSGSRRGSSASLENPLGPLSIPVSAEERDAIKVNNVNAADLKNACDDALKRVRAPPYPGQHPLNHSAVSVASELVQTDTPPYGRATHTRLGRRRRRRSHRSLRLESRL
jgi:hypothetical protein